MKFAFNCSLLTQDAMAPAALINISSVILVILPSSKPLKIPGKTKTLFIWLGWSLLPILKKEENIRDYLMFGYWGGGINITDGRYTYFCYPKDMKNQDLYQYTLMPMHMTKMFTVEELKGASLAGPFDFTKGVQLLRIPHKSKADTKTHSYHFPEAMEDTRTVMYDLENDPGQTKPVTDKKILKKFQEALFLLMKENNAPEETIKRMRESFNS